MNAQIIYRYDNDNKQAVFDIVNIVYMKTQQSGKKS